METILRCHTVSRGFAEYLNRSVDQQIYRKYTETAAEPDAHVIMRRNSNAVHAHTKNYPHNMPNPFKNAVMSMTPVSSNVCYDDL